MSLEPSAKLLDDRQTRGVVLLERDQHLGHFALPALVELPDHVGADLARRREDPEQIGPSAGTDLIEGSTEPRASPPALS